MIWITLIIDLIEAEPMIVALIKKVIDMIHGHPLQVIHEHALTGILTAFHTHRDAEQAKAALQTLHDRLVATLPAAA